MRGFLSYIQTCVFLTKLSNSLPTPEKNYYVEKAASTDDEFDYYNDHDIFWRPRDHKLRRTEKFVDGKHYVGGGYYQEHHSKDHHKDTDLLLHRAHLLLQDHEHRRRIDGKPYYEEHHPKSHHYHHERGHRFHGRPYYQEHEFRGRRRKNRFNNWSWKRHVAARSSGDQLDVPNLAYHSIELGMDRPPKAAKEMTGKTTAPNVTSTSTQHPKTTKKEGKKQTTKKPSHKSHKPTKPTKTKAKKKSHQDHHPDHSHQQQQHRHSKGRYATYFEPLDKSDMESVVREGLRLTDVNLLPPGYRYWKLSENGEVVPMETARSPRDISNSSTKTTSKDGINEKDAADNEGEEDEDGEEDDWRSMIFGDEDDDVEDEERPEGRQTHNRDVSPTP